MIKNTTEILVPVPKVVSKEQVLVYISPATYTTPGIAAFNPEQFIISDNVVSLNGNLIDMVNGTGEGAVQQIPNGVAGGFEFGSNKNPNAVEFDPSLNGTIPYGATGDYAASFGGKSAAIGKRSHSEGTTTIAKGAYSHAEGDNAVALGDDSHAEGYKTTAYGEGSHAEGNNTISKGKYSHTEGYSTATEGEAAHSEGSGNVSAGESSHTEGKANTAQGIASHAEGIGNVVEGKHAHVEGSYNKVYATSAHAEGLENTIDEGAEGAHTSGRGNHAKHEGVQLLGRGLISGRRNQTVVGQYNRYDDEAIFVVGTGTDKDHPANSFAICTDGTVKYLNVPRTIRISLSKDFKLQARLYTQTSDEVDANPGLFPMAYSNEIDFPLEATVMGGRFDETSKDLILTLQNGTDITIPLDDIISGLATETYVQECIPDLEDFVQKDAFNNVVTEVGTVVDNHESRISALEEGSSSSGGKIYRHDVVLRCSDYMNTPYASVYCRFVSSSDAPLTTLEEMKTYCFATEPWTTAHYKASLYLIDDSAGAREVTTVAILSSKVSVSYITAYTVPLATDYVSFDASVCSITDIVTEV